MRKIFLSVSLGIFGLFTTIHQSFAHVGGGPPFLEINGGYAVTNPYYQGEAAFNVTQDIAPKEIYPVNQPIHFEVDTSKLLIPPEVANNSLFRWSIEKTETFFEKPTEYKMAKSIDLTFDKNGSYLVILEAHAATEYEFTVIDTVQINASSNPSYTLPKPTILIGTKNMKVAAPITYVSKTIFDPSVKSATYMWDSGNNTLQKGQSITVDYSNSQPLTYFYHRVRDDHGFVTDVGFDVYNTNGSLEFHPFGSMTSAPFTIKSPEEILSVRPTGSSSSFNPLMLLLIIPVGILLAFIVSLARKKK